MLTGEPFIPQNITVHLGFPDSDAPNVTLPFPDYIKNVTSSEIFPTWSEVAIRSNIYVIVTFALNRIYTEWYRSR
ncbi:MAG TPA: spore cortex-lytic protein, partial [Ruminococcus sp.]|nr:spore cortex-lytic protein [Ruminococcus sp.]